MDHLLTWVQEQEPKLHPVVVSAILHYNFVRIHPFPDGNGRMARLLMNLIILRNTFTPIMIQPTEKSEYIQVLNEGHQNHDVNPFVEFIAEKMVLSQEAILQMYRLPHE
jgi:Fic family protein